MASDAVGGATRLITLALFQFISFHLFLDKIFFAVISVLKMPFSNFYDFCIFKCHIIMNTKLKFQVGPEAPNFSGAPGPMLS